MQNSEHRRQNEGNEDQEIKIEDESVYSCSPCEIDKAVISQGKSV